MGTTFHIIHVVVSFTFLIANLYFLLLWCFGLWRTGLALFWVLAISGTLFFCLTAVQCLLAIGSSWALRFFGLGTFTIAYELFLAVQPLALLVAVVGHTMTARWIIRSHGRVPDVQTVQPR